MTVFNDTFDKSTPAGTDSPSEADDRMREIKAATQERENVDHFWPLTGTEVSDPDTGEHRKITFHESIADPDAVAGKAFCYLKDGDLWYRGGEDEPLQLTTGGVLLLADGSVDQDTIRLSNNEFLRSIDAAGTGTVALISANSSDVVVIRSGAGKPARFTNFVAPVADEDIAPKKYVDDSVAMTPATESDDKESDGVTVFTNGFRIARGVETVNANSESGAITPEGFTKIYNPQLTLIEDNNNNQFAPKLGNHNDTTFTIRNTNDSQATIEWMCIGR